MILSFKEQFVSKILTGEKVHTIREDKRNRWHKDVKIHFASNVRTKYQQTFKTGKVTSIQSVVFVYYSPSNSLSVEIDGHLIESKEEYKAFAKADGFDTTEELEQWFIPLCKEPIGHTSNKLLSYKAKLIHWTDITY